MIPAVTDPSRPPQTPRRPAPTGLRERRPIELAPLNRPSPIVLPPVAPDRTHLEIGSLLDDPDSTPAGSGRMLAVTESLLAGPMAAPPRTRLSFREISEGGDAREVDQAFAAGINSRLETLEGPLPPAPERTQQATNRIFFSKKPTSHQRLNAPSSFLEKRLHDILTGIENGEDSDIRSPKRARTNEPPSSSSSSSSSSNLHAVMPPPSPRMGRGLPMGADSLSAPLPFEWGLVLPDVAGFANRLSSANEGPNNQSLKCPDTPCHASILREGEKYLNTPCIDAMKILRAKIARDHSFSLNTPDGIVTFTIERKIDASMGKHAEVYVGFFRGKDGIRVPSVLKLPKAENVGLGEILNRIVHQMVIQAQSESDEVLKPHMPKYYNFGNHPHVVREIYYSKGLQAAREYVKNQADLAFQLAEFVPDEFPPVPENGERIEWSLPQWTQFVEIIKRCALKNVPHDFLRSNLRVLNGIVKIIDNYEFYNDDETIARLRVYFKNDWKFCADDLKMLFELLEQAENERPPVEVKPYRANSPLLGLSLIGSDDEKDQN